MNFRSTIKPDRKRKKKKFCVEDTGFKIFILFKRFNLQCPFYPSRGEVILKHHILITLKIGSVKKVVGGNLVRDFFSFNELWFPDVVWICFKGVFIHMQFHSRRIKQVKPKQVFHLYQE